MSTHIICTPCKKTYDADARDGHIHSFEVDALIAPVKQDLIGGRAIANGLKFQVILDQDPNTCRIYPRMNRKLCGVEQPIPFVSDDLRLFRTKALHLANAAEVNRQPLNETTHGKKQWCDSRREKKRKLQNGNRNGQDRQENRFGSHHPEHCMGMQSRRQPTAWLQYCDCRGGMLQATT